MTRLNPESVRRNRIQGASLLLRRGVSAIALAAGGALAASPAVSAQEADSFTLEEIVVTAQFRASQLQETPIAITAVTGAMMEARNMVYVSAISASTPSVNIRSGGGAFGNSAQAFIRGIGELDFNFALEPGVGFYVDDVYHATLAGAIFDLVDLERVEVLRGPQGTLFGKNAIGGAVRLISQKPKGDNSGYASATYGSYDRLELKAMFDVPLIADTLFLRLAGSSRQRDGHVTRLDFVCEMNANGTPALAGSLPQLISGQDDCKIGTLGGQDVQGFRASARWLVSDDIEINVNADYSDESSDPVSSTLKAVNTSAAELTNLNAMVNIPTFGIPLDGRFVPADPYVSYATFIHPVTGRVNPPETRMESWGVGGTIDWSIMDNLQLKSITAYRAYDGAFVQDMDNSPLIFNHALNLVEHHQFSQELQLLGTAFGGAFEWVVGGFYFDGYSRNSGHIDVAFAVIPFGPAGLGFDINDPSNVENKSAFVHGVYHVTDKLNVTAGLRYTDEFKDYQFSRSHPAQFLINGRRGETNSTEWSPKIVVDYRWTPDVMTYAQFSTGFRTGGINPRPVFPADVLEFGPEHLNSYEIGLKSEWLDHRLRLNVAGYWSNYSDLQLTIVRAPGTIIANVGTAEIKGVEFELDAQPVEGLLINATLSYMDFKLTDLGSQPLAAPAPTLNSKPRGVPDWQASLGAQYQIDLGNAGSLTPRIDMYYQSKVYNLWTNSEISADPKRTTLDGRLTWMSPDMSWSAALAVTNLTDKLYYVNQFDLYGNGILEAQPARPREWSMSVRRSF